jgi:small subunit ribosomal protein S9
MANLSSGLRHLRCQTKLPKPQWHQSLSIRPRTSSKLDVRQLTSEAQPPQAPSQGLPPSAASPAAASMEAIKIPYQGVHHARHVPASPSYFTREPSFTDLYIRLTSMLTKYHHLPTLQSNEAPILPWMRLEHIRQQMGEPIKASYFAKVIRVAKRLNLIEPSVRPDEVNIVIQQITRAINPLLDRPRPLTVDKFGRAVGVGKRKASTARAFVVEGTGEFLVNGKPLTEMFGRVHDRESAAWALMSTQRIDKYNVWALVRGGGTTGQAEALTLAVAKALLAHEPALKPALRKGKCRGHASLPDTNFTLLTPLAAGCITRDPRTVERKKHGRVKARKGPAWVKR